MNDAKEIILTNGAIEPRSKNTYICIGAREPEFDFDVVSDWKLREANKQFDTSVLKNSQRTICEVCALGALFLADVDRNNHVTVGDICGKSLSEKRFQIEERLINLFTQNELLAIEAVFEDTFEAQRAPKLYRAVYAPRFQWDRDDKDVLLRILDWLIKNDSVVK